MITASKILSDKCIVPTPQRVAVYEALVGRKDHPTVDTIFAELRAKLPTLSKTTVYTTMQLLTDHALIRTVHAEPGEIRYDPTCCRHAHFKCKACGQLHDIPLSSPDGKLLAVMPTGFVCEEEELIYYGLCPNCSTRQRKEKKK